MTDRPMRVLYIDDDEDDFILLQNLLAGSPTPIELTWKSDLAEALRSMQSRQHDVYLIDYLLGPITGLELMADARAGGCEGPVILLTGQGSENVDAQALEQGAADYLIKSELTAPLLLRSIRYALAHHRDQQALLLRDRAIGAANQSITIVQVDSQYQYPLIYVNPAFTRITGYSAEEALGRNCRFLQNGDRDQPGIDELRHALSHGVRRTIQLRNYRKNGELFWNEVSIAPITDRNGEVTHFVGVQKDITLQKHAEAHVRQAESQRQFQATHDPLTGLPNRFLLEDRLSHLIQLIHSHTSQLAVLAINLDRFEAINGDIGFSAGDTALRIIGHRLLSALADGDTLCRSTGDEFLLVLHDCGTAEALQMWCQALHGVIAEPLPLDDQPIRLTASIGVALWEDAGLTATDLLRRANSALKRAKREGRNTTAVFTPQLDAVPDAQISLRSEFHAALNSDQFILHFQPQVDCRQQRITGMEALVRWQHPRLGLLPPGQFIAIAEDSGHIAELGEWVMAAACQQNQQWQSRGVLRVPVAVNVSAIQLNRDNFVASVKNILTQTGLPADQLELELTEGIMFNDVESVIDKMQALKKLGVKLSIDDFGTGYSSLGYLQRLPIDRLKIDRCFLEALHQNPNDHAIVRAIIGLGHHLQLNVIAEGVETPSQLQFLSRHLCDEAQGYLISRPLTATAVEAFVQTHRTATAVSVHAGHRPTLLLVDDEENILRALQRVFRHEGYQILTAHSASTALALLNNQPVQVILSDQSMPGMSGVAFLSTVREHHPDITRLVLTGYTDLQTVTQAVNESAVYKFIAKPWNDDELRTTVKDAFLHHEETVR